MDVDRLFLALEAARNEYTELGLEARLQNLANSLQQLAAQPSDSNAATAFKSQFGDLATVLQNAQSNLAPPIRRMVWDATKLSRHMGLSLAARITKVIDDNRMTPQLAVTEMTALLDEVKTSMAVATSITTGLASLGLKSPGLSPGEYELGFSFPKTLVKPQANLVADELHELQKVLRAFAEVTGAPIDSVVLKKIGSSEWQFFFEAYAPTAAFLAVAIERIVTLYKTNLEIRKLKRDLESKNFP